MAAVGTPTVNTTLSVAASAGATNIHTATVTNISAGDTVTLNLGATSQETTTGHGRRHVRHRRGRPHPGARAHLRARGTESVQDLGTGVTVSPALTFAHAAGATVFDAGTGVTLATPLTLAHAAGAAVYFSGNGAEPNIQEIEVSDPEPGTWTAKFVWNGIDQDAASAPPLPGLYTGPMNVDIQGSKWQYSPATAPVTIPAHASATIPISYQFPGTPGDYPQSIQFAADDGGTTSVPFVGRSIIPTGFNIPFNTLITSAVGRNQGPAQMNQYNVNVPAGSQSISVNLTTPDASADNKFTYYTMVSPALTDPSPTRARSVEMHLDAGLPVSVTEPQTVNGVLTNNGVLDGQQQPASRPEWQIDVFLDATGER